MVKALALLALVPSLALAQGLSRPLDPRHLELPLWTALRNAVLSNTASMGNYALPADHGFRVTTVSTWVTVGGGGGAGNTVISLTDGTNTCTATMTCAASQTTGVKRFTLTGNCTYSPGALITASVTTAGCTSTQPTGSIIQVSGYWL